MGPLFFFHPSKSNAESNAMPRGKPFEKGHKLAPGGPRPNSGRPPNEFREWLGNIVHSEAARRRFEKILMDKDDADEIVTSEGVCVPHRAKANVYLQALELAWNYEQGKPNQPLSNADGSELAAIPTAAIAEIVAALAGGKAPGSSSGAGEEERT